MALYNLVRVHCTTRGTGTLTVGEAVTGWLDFTNVASGQVTYTVRNGDQTEIGHGTYDSTAGTLARTTVLSSTNNNAAIDIDDDCEVALTISAEDFGSAFLPDGDYGDISVSNSGATFSIDSNVISAYGRTLTVAADAATARTTLGLGTMAVEPEANYYTTTEVNAITATLQPLDADLTAIAALTTAAYGRSLLEATSEANFKALVNLEIGVDVQAYAANLTTWAGVAPSANGQSLVSAANYAAMRTLLDLEAGTDFYSIAAADAAFQPKDADLTTWAGLTPSANAQSLVTAANYAAMRALLDLEAGTDFYSIAAADAAFQAKDADLTSWAGVTRAAGFDTFAATPTSANLATLVSDETGSGALVFATSPTLVTPTLGVAAATSITLSSGTGLQVGASIPFSDSAGTLTLQNVDALDATTEATIEAAIDTLANLASIQGVSFTFGSYAATILNTTSEVTFKQAVNLELGVDVQAYDNTLAALASVITAADKVIYATALDAFAATDFTAAGRSMVGAASAAAQTALLSAFTGDSGAGGVKGLVPAPAAGDAAATKFLKADGTWAAPSGAGDVVGPASSTDNAIARFNGTGGKTLQNSGITIDDSDGMAGVTSINDGPLAGFRNHLINGCMRFNQRGPATNADDTYGFDRWIVLTQTSTVAVTQLTDVENTTPYMQRITQSQASAQRFGVEQIIEARNSKHLRGKAVRLSARVRMSAATTLRYAILEWTGTADAVTSDVVLSWTSGTFTAGNFFLGSNLTVTATGSTALSANTLTDVNLSATLGSSTNNVIVLFWTDSTQAQNVTLDVGKVQLEIGTVSTSFERRQYQIEEVLCRRYYGIYPISVDFVAVAASAVGAACVAFPSRMFASATGTLLSSPAPSSNNNGSTGWAGADPSYGLTLQVVASAGANTRTWYYGMASAEAEL